MEGKKRKEKGGAEKARMNKKRMLEESVSKWSIIHLFIYSETTRCQLVMQVS